VAYATTADLEAWLDPEPLPPNAERLLEEASDDLDEVLIGAVYDTDEDGQPTDPDVAEMLRKATVRQVHWMMRRDDETGADSDVQSMTVGQRSFTRRTVGSAAGTTPKVGPRAAQILRTSGLLTMWPVVVG
jgi:hypothetical protein